ncbi:hypothetical protein YTPLAS18_14930 [Nitrospira sp.]|nr:hypothetical protein YTPLAS18_14930 [Nitrospira sp.]
MDQGTDRISEDLKDIVRTRGAIADKLELIERRLTSSVEEAKAKADEIVGRTQASVQEAVDSVKAATDPQRLAHDHPWLLLSGAIAVGMTLGVALRSTSRQNGVIPYYPPNAHAAEVMPEAEHEETRQEGVYPYYPGDHAQSRARTPGSTQAASFLGDLGNVAAHEFSHVRGELLAMASGILRAWVRDTVRNVVASAMSTEQRAQRRRPGRERTV